MSCEGRNEKKKKQSKRSLCYGKDEPIVVLKARNAVEYKSLYCTLKLLAATSMFVCLFVVWTQFIFLWNKSTAKEVSIIRKFPSFAVRAVLSHVKNKWPTLASCTRTEFLSWSLGRNNCFMANMKSNFKIVVFRVIYLVDFCTFVHFSFILHLTFDEILIALFHL